MAPGAAAEKGKGKVKGTSGQQWAPAGKNKTGTGSTAANRDNRAPGQQLATKAKAKAPAGTSEHQRAPAGRHQTGTGSTAASRDNEAPGQNALI